MKIKTTAVNFLTKIKTKIKNFWTWYMNLYIRNVMLFCEDMRPPYIRYVNIYTHLPATEEDTPEEERISIREFREFITLKDKVIYILLTISYILIILSISIAIIAICNKILGITDMPERNIYQARLLYFHYINYYKFNYGKKVKFKAKPMKKLINYRYFKWNSYQYAGHVAIITSIVIPLTISFGRYLAGIWKFERWCEKNLTYYFGFYFGVFVWVIYIVALSYNIYFFHLFFPHYKIGM